MVPASRAEGASRMARLRRRGFWLEHAGMAWMTAEAAVAITAGVIASSIALAGFGLDSVIEFFAAAIVVWQLRGEIAGQDRGTRAVRLIGVTFFALALYLTAESIRNLAGHARPQRSVAGLAVAAAALIVMPLLAVAKPRTGRALGHRTLIAGSAETAFCALTSAATLLGAGLNAWLRWWWPDPAAGLVIAALAVKEGLEAWEDDRSGPAGPPGAGPRGGREAGEVGHPVNGRLVVDPPTEAGRVRLRQAGPREGRAQREAGRKPGALGSGRPFAEARRGHNPICRRSVAH